LAVLKNPVWEVSDSADCAKKSRTATFLRHYLSQKIPYGEIPKAQTVLRVAYGKHSIPLYLYKVPYSEVFRAPPLLKAVYERYSMKPTVLKMAYGRHCQSFALPMAPYGDWLRVALVPEAPYSRN
jgi:hypothetical protein